MERLGPRDLEAFGKLLRAREGLQLEAWLPLADHMADVASCFERLCQCRSIRRALHEAAARKLDDVDIARLTVLVFLHDIGKASSGFQSKRWVAEDRPKYWPFPAGHGAQAIYLLQGENPVSHLVDALPIDDLIAWGEEGLLPLLFATISHHGRPIVEESEAVRRVSGYDWKPVMDPAGKLRYDPQPVISKP
jgi:CRISPR-associated endonuclease/helicase Cas3